MMKTTKDALKEQEAEMLKQFNVVELEERLEMSKWEKPEPTPTVPPVDL